MPFFQRCESMPNFDDLNSITGITNKRITYMAISSKIPANMPVQASASRFVLDVMNIGGSYVLQHFYGLNPTCRFYRFGFLSQNGWESWSQF